MFGSNNIYLKYLILINILTPKFGKIQSFTSGTKDDLHNR